MEVLRWLVTASFVALAAMGLQLWWRRRLPGAAWLISMFFALAAARVAGQLLPEQPTGLLAAVGIAVPTISAIFPYLLFRFAEGFQPVSPQWRRLVALLAGALLVAALATSSTAAVTGAEASWYRAFVLSVLVAWTAVTGWVVWRFVSAGRRQPTLTRRRMWTMAGAAGLLNTALLFAGLGETDALAAAGQGMALASAATFVLAFSPPRFVRAMWRQADERALWDAEGALVAADTRDAVVWAVLPHVAALLGSKGAMFVDRFGKDTAVGLDDASREHVHRQLLATPGQQEGAVVTAGVATLALEQGRLGIETSPYAPVFGRDELQLVQRLGGLLDLALSRAEASMKSATLAAFEQALVPRIHPPAGLLVDTRYRAGLERLELGGDFMDVLTVSDDGAAFVLGDVSGHGPEEAAFAVGVRAGWLALATVDPHDPSAWLSWLDLTFVEGHPERLVTALVGLVGVAQQSVTLVSAGHCAPMVVGLGAHVVPLQPEPLLGVGHSERRKDATLTLEPGQGLFLYTDGLVEQHRPDRPGERWDEADLLAWFQGRDLDDISLDDLLWQFGRDAFADDVAVMLLRFDPAARDAGPGA